MNTHEIQWPCPVCGHDSFGEPPGSFGICSVCNWEDDPVQIKHPRMRGGANTGSIFDYQKNRLEWILDPDIPRDSEWRLMGAVEAALADDEVGRSDCSLDYYGDAEPYYWRGKNVAEQVAASDR